MLFLFRPTAAMLLALLFAAPAHANPVRLSGEVTYRQRVELPANASLTVRLLDLLQSPPDVVVEAIAPIARRGQVPLQFTLNFDDTRLSAGHRYGLEALIIAEDQVWFRNELPLAVDPASGAGGSMVIVDFVGQIATNANNADTAGARQVPGTSLNVSAELTDTLWVMEMNGAPRPGASPVTLSIAADRRAGGSGPCNNYFAQAAFDGPQLTFSSVVATKRACPTPVMEDERTFFDALAQVRGYRLSDSRLELLDSGGARLLRFRLKS